MCVAFLFKVLPDRGCFSHLVSTSKFIVLCFSPFSVADNKYCTLAKLQRKVVWFGSCFWPRMDRPHLAMVFLLAQSQGSPGYRVVRDKENGCVSPSSGLSLLRKLPGFSHGPPPWRLDLILIASQSPHLHKKKKQSHHSLVKLPSS